MLINFSSISKNGVYTVYEVAPAGQQQNYGSFVVCSVTKCKLEPRIGITGTIRDGGITLVANGTPLPYRLRIGNKGINQLRLWQLGYHIPHTVVLDFSVCEAFKRDQAVDLGDIYRQVIKPLSVSVAIRCSSNLEDSDTQSFAGFFDTHLKVPNQLDNIQEKIVQSYRKFCVKGDGQREMFQYNIQLGIMLQQMIKPKFSGFLFTLDPVDPPSDGLKIEYWKGPREESEGYSITLNRETGKRVSSGADSNQVPPPTSIREKLHYAAIELERYFGTPQDAEFLISGAADSLYLVQSRPITAFSYSPDNVRRDEQRKLAAILDENKRLYHLNPILSSTNITELFIRALPLGYSIFKYGFAGTSKLSGGISIGRSRLGYVRINPKDGVKLFYTVADQARTNIIVDALTFRLPGISKREYLNIFVKHYLEQIAINPVASNYPEDGLYLQTDDPMRWLEIAGAQGEQLRGEFTKFLQKIIHVHAPREYGNAGKFFRQNDRRYHSYLNQNVHTKSPKYLKQEIEDILSYLRSTFCPQYVVYARLAFLCTHVAKTRLSALLKPSSGITPEKILNELLRKVKIPAELQDPSYPEFELLYKLGMVPLVEFLLRFQHLGPLDITEPRLGEFLPEELYAVFGQSKVYGLVGDFPDDDDTDHTSIDITGLGFINDPAFRKLYIYAGRFMHLREKAKSDLMKLLWVLKRLFVEFARQNRFGDLIYYLELDEALSLGSRKREELRLLALQRKAYLDACRQYRVKDVLLDLRSTPFEENTTVDDQADAGSNSIVRGRTIFHGHAEGVCLTASSNEEFIKKLTAYRAKNIESIIGVFKGVEPSYLNLSALAGFTTENGGYLSHAATIAREFGLSYITGIGIDQFRDGDNVILDTENEQVIIRR